MNRRWICADVWMDTFPFFDHAQLGLKMALLSPRFDVLVDKHFDGKSELTIWRPITIRKNSVKAVPELSIFMENANFVSFPLPDNSLPNKIRFKSLHINYIDHFIIAFLRSNQQIWDKGTHLGLCLPPTDTQPIWDVLVRQIWPIFSTNIRRLRFPDDGYLESLCRHTSPTILSDLNQLDSINSGTLLPDAIGDDGPNAISAGQTLSKWLHSPRKDGQPKQLFCHAYEKIEWVNKLKELFVRATTSASYKIQFTVYAMPTPMMPFELMNGRTNEKLTLKKENSFKHWIMRRCQNGETAAIWWEDENSSNLNNVSIFLNDKKCIGQLSRHQKKKKRNKAAKKGRASSDNE